MVTREAAPNGLRQRRAGHAAAEGSRRGGDDAAVAAARGAAETPGAQAAPSLTSRQEAWAFLEAQTSLGRTYELVSLVLILGNVVAFIAGSIFDRRYNVDPESRRYVGPECGLCDALFFGQQTASGTSLLEVVSALLFTCDYVLRLWASPEGAEYRHSRWTYATSFFSLVDLASVLPFYAELVLPGHLPAMQFLRVLRLLRMMRVEGRYAEAFTLFDDVVAANRRLIATAGFVGIVVWLVLSGLFHLAERWNTKMIYCPRCPDVEADRCAVDAWGNVDCAPAGCTGQCWNLYESIPGASYFTLLNLFGEFPLADRQGPVGKVLATFVAVVAVFVFGIPTGILGNGYLAVLRKKRQEEKVATAAAASSAAAGGNATCEAAGNSAKPIGGASATTTDESSSLRRSLHSLFNGRMGTWIENMTFIIILESALHSLFESKAFAQEYPQLQAGLAQFELCAAALLTAEMILRAYAVGADPAFAGIRGLLRHVFSFYTLVDMASVLPYWWAYFLNGSVVSGGGTLYVRYARLLRILKSERYVEALTLLDDVLKAHKDVLLVSGFSSAVLWVTFSALLYLTERNNPDASMAAHYRTIPHSMWVTLLGIFLGEAPLCFYTPAGRVLTGAMGTVAVGVVAIPIGILGAGFSDSVEAQREASGDEDADEAEAESDPQKTSEGWQSADGNDVVGGRALERVVIGLILASVVAAIIETLPGFECGGGARSSSSTSLTCQASSALELVAGLVFLAEYLLRLYFSRCRLSFVCSFHSFMDILAMLPWCLRRRGGGLLFLLRILRLVKIDEYAPALSRMGRVFALKRHALLITGIVAAVAWLACGFLMEAAESRNVDVAIGTVPLLGCGANCTMADRFGSATASMPFALIHLTGDYPIIDYSWPGRAVCFFMVILGSALAGVPTGLVADGFTQVMRGRTVETSALGAYDVAYRKLEGTKPPREFAADWLDALQTWSNELLNGRRDCKGAVAQRNLVGRIFNGALLLLVGVNALAAVVESVPAVDRAIGNAPGNAFDLLEMFSVFIFTAEYLLRVFSVTKDREHLYSRRCYFTTFFSVVDLLAVLPWYLQQGLQAMGYAAGDQAAMFRILRLFRLLQLEHFVVAFSVLDNVFRRSRELFFATGYVALTIWIISSALFFILEHDNPNWCARWTESRCADAWSADCVCQERVAFESMPDAMYYVAIFLGGEWAIVDFTALGKVLCCALCLVGIAIYSVPVGALFDAFGQVLEEGLSSLDAPAEGAAS